MYFWGQIFIEHPLIEGYGRHHSLKIINRANWTVGQVVSQHFPRAGRAGRCCWVLRPAKFAQTFCRTTDLVKRNSCVVWIQTLGLDDVWMTEIWMNETSFNCLFSPLKTQRMAGEEGESLPIFEEKLTSTCNYSVDTRFTTAASTPLDMPRCHEKPFDSANS